MSMPEKSVPIRMAGSRRCGPAMRTAGRCVAPGALLQPSRVLCRRPLPHWPHSASQHVQRLLRSRTVLLHRLHHSAGGVSRDLVPHPFPSEPGSVTPHAGQRHPCCIPVSLCRASCWGCRCCCASSRDWPSGPVASGPASLAVAAPSSMLAMATAEPGGVSAVGETS